MRLLKEIEDNQSAQPDAPAVGVQMSEFLDSQERFFCIGFSQHLDLREGAKDSVIIGFQVDRTFEGTVQFASDPDIPRVIINETCERCPLMEDQCSDRGAPAYILERQSDDQKRLDDLKQLLAELQK